MAWVMIPYTLTNTLAQILFATGNQAFDLKVNVIATLTSVLLNLALIPQWGFVGAAFASLGTMMLHVSLQYSFVRRHVYDPRMTETFLRLGAATIPCANVAAHGNQRSRDVGPVGRGRDMERSVARIHIVADPTEKVLLWRPTGGSFLEARFCQYR